MRIDALQKGIFLIAFKTPAKQMLNETARATLGKNMMKPSKKFRFIQFINCPKGHVAT